METYDEQTELDNARAVLLSNNDLEEQPVEDMQQPTVFAFSNNGTNEDETLASLLPTATISATVPVDDLLDTQDYGSESEEEVEPISVNPEILEVDEGIVDDVIDEEFNIEIETEKRRRIDDGTHNSKVENKPDIRQLAKDELDLSLILKGSKESIKKIFRSGWGNCDELARSSIEITCPRLTSDALEILSYAGALMIDDLVKASAAQTLKRGKRTLTYEDVSTVVNTLDRLAFLQDAVPISTQTVAPPTAVKHKQPIAVTPAQPQPNVPSIPTGRDIASFFKKVDK